MEVVQRLLRTLTALAALGAKRILGTPRAVVDGVHEMLLLKQAQSPKDARLVHSAQPRLKVGKRQRALSLSQSPRHYQAHSRRFDAALRKKFLAIVMMHNYKWYLNCEFTQFIVTSLQNTSIYSYDNTIRHPFRPPAPHKTRAARRDERRNVRFDAPERLKLQTDIRRGTAAPA